MPSAYNLEFSNQAEKFLKKLDNKQLLLEFASIFDDLRINPYLGKFLQGDLKGYHSIRIRRYRIIYKLFHHRLLIYIEHISHRKESYR